MSVRILGVALEQPSRPVGVDKAETNAGLTVSTMCIRALLLCAWFVSITVAVRLVLIDWLSFNPTSRAARV